MASSKRARDAFAQFEVVSVKPDVLRLFDNDGSSIEFKCVNAKTGLFSATGLFSDGRVFVGNYNHCLDLRGQNGGGPVMGLTLDKTLDIYADAHKKRYFLGDVLPRDEWNAHFSFKSPGYADAIRVQICFDSPMKAHEGGTLEAELDMFLVK